MPSNPFDEAKSLHPQLFFRYDFQQLKDSQFFATFTQQTKQILQDFLKEIYVYVNQLKCKLTNWELYNQQRRTTFQALQARLNKLLPLWTCIEKF